MCHHLIICFRVSQWTFVLFWLCFRSSAATAILHASPSEHVCAPRSQELHMFISQILPSYFTECSSVYSLTSSVWQFPLLHMKVRQPKFRQCSWRKRAELYLVLLCIFLFINEISLFLFFLWLNPLTVHFTHLKFISHLFLVHLELCNYTVI